MRCPECGGEINETEVFCPSCGAELFGSSREPVESDVFEVLEDVDTENAGKKRKRQRIKGTLPQKAKNKRNAAAKGKNQKLAVGARIAGIVILLAVVVILIIAAVNSIGASKGRKIFDSADLGRDVEMIKSKTKAEFISGKASAYGAVNHISDYDYICESEKAVNVNGIQLPEWAVLLKADDGGAVNEATLYNFSVLKHNWMGAKTAERIEPSTVEFGMTAKTAERALGLKPYTITKESKENTTVYIYRYNYTDSESGNICVRNFSVEVSDVDGKVKSAYDSQLDYLNLIFGGGAGD